MKYYNQRTAYLAARYDLKEDMRAVERVLEEHGIMPGTPWLHQDTDIRNTNSDEEREHIALVDVQGVLNADFLILFTEDLTEDNLVPASWARGGRHTEFGIAIGASMDTVIIGPRQNLLHFHEMSNTDIKKLWRLQFDTLDEFLSWYDANNITPDDAE